MPAQVLAGYTFSNDDDSDVNWVMINRSVTSFGSAESDAFNISKNMCLQYVYNKYVGAYDILVPEGYYMVKHILVFIFLIYYQNIL